MHERCSTCARSTVTSLLDLVRLFFTEDDIECVVCLLIALTDIDTGLDTENS